MSIQWLFPDATQNEDERNNMIAAGKDIRARRVAKRLDNALRKLPPISPRPSKDCNIATVYALFSSDGTALYVGVSRCLIRRLRDHRYKQLWWKEVARIEIQEFTREEQWGMAESETIQRLQPIYNIQGVAPW
jgi:hypothetical protein